MAIKKILLVASFLLLLIQTYANTAYFKHLSVQDGLSQVNIIYCCPLKLFEPKN